MKIHDLKTGDILLYRSNHLLAKAIRFFTNGKVNHASICVIISDEIFVAESEKEGFVLNKLADSIKGRKILVMRYSASVAEKKLAMRVMSMIGKHRYDFASLLFFQAWYAITGNWIGRRDKHASKRLYCSEAIAYIYNEEVGIMNEWWKYNPQMIFEEPGFTIDILEG